MVKPQLHLHHLLAPTPYVLTVLSVLPWPMTGEAAGKGWQEQLSLYGALRSCSFPSFSWAGAGSMDGAGAAELSCARILILLSQGRGGQYQALTGVKWGLLTSGAQAKRWAPYTSHHVCVAWTWKAYPCCQPGPSPASPGERGSIPAHFPKDYHL